MNALDELRSVLQIASTPIPQPSTGLWYPRDPASYEISTLGGNVAATADGLCCGNYRVMGDYRYCAQSS